MTNQCKLFEIEPKFIFEWIERIRSRVKVPF